MLKLKALSLRLQEALKLKLKLLASGGYGGPGK